MSLDLGDDRKPPRALSRDQREAQRYQDYVSSVRATSKERRLRESKSRSEERQQRRDSREEQARQRWESLADQARQRRDSRAEQQRQRRESRAELRQRRESRSEERQRRRSLKSRYSTTDTAKSEAETPVSSQSLKSLKGGSDQGSSSTGGGDSNEQEQGAVQAVQGADEEKLELQRLLDEARKELEDRKSQIQKEKERSRSKRRKQKGRTTRKGAKSSEGELDENKVDESSSPSASQSQDELSLEERLALKREELALKREEMRIMKEQEALQQRAKLQAEKGGKVEKKVQIIADEPAGGSGHGQSMMGRRARRKSSIRRKSSMKDAIYLQELLNKQQQGAEGGGDGGCVNCLCRMQNMRVRGVQTWVTMKEESVQTNIIGNKLEQRVMRLERDVEFLENKLKQPGGGVSATFFLTQPSIIALWGLFVLCSKA
jgi:arginine/glutamate-rich protein 1